MAIMNRTPDSFYDNGATFVAAALTGWPGRRDGADIVDIGGVRQDTAPTSVAEELRRTADLVAPSGPTSPTW